MRQIFKKICQYVGLPQNSVPRGDHLLTMYTISSIFRLLMVTHGQGLLSIKYNALYMCKQHPTEYLGGPLHHEPYVRLLFKPGDESDCREVEIYSPLGAPYSGKNMFGITFVPST